MSDKIERYNDIAIELAKFAPIFAKGDDHDAELEAAKTIRELRQIIERLRRVVDDEQPPVEVHSLQDAMKLNKDELAYVLWQFLQWINNDEGDCPAIFCIDFPCQYRREQKAMCEENLANGDLDNAGMKDQEKNGFYACYCNGDQQGCWAEYYLWCYRNGVNPLNGKKEVQQ